MIDPNKPAEANSNNSPIVNLTNKGDNDPKPAKPMSTNPLLAQIDKLKSHDKCLDALRALSTTTGGDRGLIEKNGCFYSEPYAAFMVNFPDESEGLKCLEATQGKDFKSVPKLVEFIRFSKSSDGLAIVETPNHSSLISYPKAKNNGFINQNNKSKFMDEMKQLLSLGVMPDEILAFEAANLFYDKKRDTIMFLDLDAASFIDPQIAEGQRIRPEEIEELL